MTKMMTRTMLTDSVVDAYSNRVHLGDRAVDLNSGCVCVVLDHCPELGPESLYVQLVEHDGPDMTYWVEPSQLVKLPRDAA
ncbi:MAG: hypothetical protein KDB68_08905 [Planctomycetes bacterium]|nr:hypothetical protein [Planctomycetota bacterium]MCA8936314.1 hypothetical protein [Planctomycetota bacterium]